LKNNFRKKQNLTLNKFGSSGSIEGTAKIASPRIMKNLSVNSPHGSRNASPHSQKSGGFAAGMQEELDAGAAAGLQVGKHASTKPKGNFGIKMDIEVEEMNKGEEESKNTGSGAFNKMGLSGGVNPVKKKSSQLGILRPSKFSSSNSNLSQGSAIDDVCSMDD